jgi:molybdopterin/thiamine biosynthesis adenylyltransferase
MPRALSVSKTLRALNPNIEVTPVDWQFDEDDLAEQIRRADVVLDCSDNFETRFAINDACVNAGTPLAQLPQLSAKIVASY